MDSDPLKLSDLTTVANTRWIIDLFSEARNLVDDALTGGKMSSVRLILYFMADSDTCELTVCGFTLKDVCQLASHQIHQCLFICRSHPQTQAINTHSCEKLGGKVPYIIL